MSPHDRVEARRAAERKERLDEMDRQIEDGSLVVRKMTAAEMDAFSPSRARGSSKS